MSQLNDSYYESSSMLRSSLTGMTPVRTKEIVKKSGLKFVQERIDFEYDIDTDEPQSYEEYLTTQTKMVLNHISIPLKFEKGVILDLIVNRAMDNYNKDEEFKKIENEIEESKGTLSPFIDLIHLCQTRYKNEIAFELKENSELYYITNMPFNVLTSFTRRTTIGGMFLDHLENIFKHYNTFIDKNLVTSNKRLEDRYYKSLKQDVEQAFEKSDPLSFNYKCLLYLFFIWSAENTDDIFNVKNVNFKKAPKEEIEYLYQGLKNNMKEVRRYIQNSIYSQKYGVPRVKFPDSSLSFSDNFNEMFLVTQRKGSKI